MLTNLADEANKSWQSQDLLRTAGVFSRLDGARATISGSDYIVFSSSDYLALGQHPKVVAAAQAALEQFGAGATGSRLTTGTTELHLLAERAVADYIGADESVFFATGYQANLSTIHAIAALAPGLEVFSDKLNHASIIDGCRIARVPINVYAHRDMEDLAYQLERSHAPFCLVLTDGLFSMDGDLAPYAKLKEICRDNNAWLLVDDAHAVGTIGPGGRGSAAHANLALPDILIATGSKALGSEGGFVCCSKELATYLRNRARSYVFSTSASPASPAAITAALPLIAQQLTKLRRNISDFARLTGFSAPEPESPIIPIPIGDERLALHISNSLREAGIWIPAIRYPTVERGKAILRVTLTAHHTYEQLQTLSIALAGTMPESQRTTAKQ